MSELLDQGLLGRMQSFEGPLILVVIGHLAPHNLEDDLAHDPAVGLLLLIEAEGAIFTTLCFRGHISRSAAGRIRAARQAEVADLDLAFVVDEDVVRLQVSVGDVLGVQEPQPVEESEDHCGLVLLHL